MLNRFLGSFVFYYFPLILWMGMIFYFSSIPGLKSGASIPVEILLRKAAHFFEYFVLSFLFWRVFCLWGCSSRKACFWGVFFTIFYGMTDELHQYFIKDRTGRLLDVFIDSLGGILFCVIATFSRHPLVRKVKNLFKISP